MKSWLKRLFRSSESNRIHRRRHTPLGVETLEDRLTPASFIGVGNQLILTLTTDAEAVGIVSNGTSYTLTLSGTTWAGSNTANATGAGTDTLTVTTAGLATFELIQIVDAADNTSATFNDSGVNAYTDAIVVGLDGAGATAAFNGATQFTGASGLLVNVSRNIVVNSGASIATTDGELSFSANQQLTPTSGTFVGINVNAATISTSGTGNIGLTGKGGTTSISNFGIQLQAGAQVTSTSTDPDAGTITLDGTAGGSGSINVGVVLQGSGTQVTAVTGDILITGHGGGTTTNNHGVSMTTSAVVSSTGTDASAATITLEGTGGSTGSSNLGVNLQDPGTLITSVAGAIQIIGHGGAGSGASNFGMSVANLAVVSSTGTGPSAATITLDGTGGLNGTSSNHGVIIGGGQVLSVNGDIQITGQGGGTTLSNTGVTFGTSTLISSTGTDANAATITIDGTGGSGTGSGHGVAMTSSQVTSVVGAIQITGHGGAGSGSSINGVVLIAAKVVSTGTGPGAAPITITGTAGSGSGTLLGVQMQGAGTQITAVDGDIRITGQSGTATGGTNVGVFISNNALVSSTGTGIEAATIAIEGTGGGTGGSSSGNTGVRIQGPNGRVTSVDGLIQITGTAGVGASNAIELAIANAIQATGTANVLLTGDSMDIGDTGAVAAGSNTVTLKQKTAGTAIDLGGADAAGVLGLTNTELNRIVAGTIHIGDENTSTITVSAAIQHVGDANFLVTTGRNIVFNSATNWTTTDGDLSFSANQQMSPTSGNFNGINFSGTIETNGTGDITLRGRSGDSGTTRDGIFMVGQISSTATGPEAGTITLEGTGGSGGQLCDGVLLAGTVSSVDGAIQITGVGGTANQLQIGVWVQNDAQVTSTGTAAITITGTGGAAGGGDKDGVRISGAGTLIASVDGVIQITGTVGPGSGTAIKFEEGQIASTGTAPVTLIGDTLDIVGVIAAGTNAVTLRQQTAGTSINIGGPDASVGLTDEELDRITAGTIKIGDENTGTVTVSAAIEHDGDANFVVTTSRNIVFNSGTSWTTTNGDLSFSANQQMTPTGGNFVGIDVNGGTITTSGSGNIGLTGRGGDTGSNNIGVRLQMGAVVQSTSTGANAATISLVGTGGTGTSNHMGVAINGASTQITAAAGEIKVIGQGGNGTSTGSLGVAVNSGALVSSTGTGANAATITLEGTGGSGSGGLHGVSVSNPGTQVTSVDGAIQITGHGGPGAAQGVLIDASVVSSTGTGTNAATITLDGTGGSGTNSNAGVQIQGGGVQVTSVDGDIQITGQGGAGSGNNHDGVRLAANGLVRSTGTDAGAATITINGTGGGAGGSSNNNRGLAVLGSGARIAAVNGAIDITATAGVGTSTALHLMTSGSITVTGTAPVTLSGDSMDIAVANAIAAGSAEVTLRPKTTATAIDVGGADAAGTLGLTNDELNRITAGTISIGDVNNSGNITVSAPISFSNPDGDGPNLTLETNGLLSLNATFDTDGGDLLFQGSTIQTSGTLTTNTSGTATFNSGTLEVGASPGTATLGGPLAFTSSLTNHVELNGAAQGDEYDSIFANGVALDDPILTLDFGFMPTVGTSFTLIDNTSADAVAGTFDALPEGALLAVDGLAFQITYQGGTGTNDVVLTRIADPDSDLVVDNPGDSSDGNFGAGELTLREAIELANLLPDANTITFDTSVFSTPRTITVAFGRYVLREDVTIQGPGASLLTLDAIGGSRHFEVKSDVTAALSGLTLIRGIASSSDGGSIVNNGMLTLTASVLANNSASGGGGGAIFNGGTLFVTASTLSGNSANIGGAIFNEGVLNVISSTVSGNSGVSVGGGIANSSGSISVDSSTITGNSAFSGGGLFNNSGGTLGLTNSIVAGNTGSDVLPDIQGTVTGAGVSNLIGDPSSAGGLMHGNDGNILGDGLGGSLPIGSILNTALAPNGGPTPTHALVPGSAAIDAGLTSRQTDQRGFPRLFDDPTVANASNGVDIGAFEAQPTPFALIVDTTADVSDGDYSAGNLSLREAIEIANASSGADTITFALPDNSTITLNGTQLPTVTDDLTITGPTEGITLDGAQQSRILFIASSATASLSDLRLSNGMAIAGAGILNSGTLTLTDCTLSNNSAMHSGGGIFNSGTLSLTNCTLSNNSAGNSGGGIYSDGSAMLTNCTLSNNSAGSSGGGINNDRGTATLTGCTLSGNTTNTSGGGIANGGTMTVTNSTFSGNSAASNGGAIDNTRTLTVVNSTFAFNQAPNGGGIKNGTNRTLTLNNSIVAGNTTDGTTPNDLQNTGTLTGSNNLIGDAASSGGLTHGVNGNIVGNAGSGTLDINAILDPTLALNGGTTATHALVTNSPALNAGDNTLAVDANAEPLGFDQRGTPFSRVFNTTVDIGAFEAQSLSLVVNTTADEPVPTVGQLSLREAIQLANDNPGHDTITFAEFLGGATILKDPGLSPFNLNDDVTITGPAGGVTIDNNRGPALVNVAAGVTSNLSLLTLTRSNSVALFNAGTARLFDCTISDNVAGFGAGIGNFGILELTNCTLSGNTAGISGGGIFNMGSATLTNSTLSGNSAQQQGGGVFNGASGTLTVVNSTIVLNEAGQGEDSISGGGGIFNAGTLTLSNSIVAGNLKGTNPSTPSDIAVDGGTVSGRNNLIGAPNSAGGLTAANGNILGNGSGGLLAIEDIIDIVLSDNGGATLTHALVNGSRAIDGGVSALAVDALGALLTTDQRGADFDRFKGARVDIGAFESDAVFAGSFDGPELDDDFNLTTGRFAIVNGKAVAQGNKPAQAILDGVNLPDVALDLDVTLAGNGSRGGVLARYSPRQGNRSESYYWARLIQRNGRVFAEILRYSNGKVKKLASVRVALQNDTGNLRFEVSGSSLTLFVDGTQRAAVNDNALTGAGGVGIRARKGAALDNFVVNALAVPLARV